MQKPLVFLAILALLTVGTAQPAAADDPQDTQTTTTCVGIHPEAPFVSVDPGCIWKIIEDLPPA